MLRSHNNVHIIEHFSNLYDNNLLLLCTPPTNMLFININQHFNFININ